MASKKANDTKNMFNSIGAVQTLVENFPMSLLSFSDHKFGTSFDILTLLFKTLGIDREEIISIVTDALSGGVKGNSDSKGFIAEAEDIVKLALEANIINVLNCNTNPIISNDLLDKYKQSNVEYSGEGITLDVAELDFTGVLSHSPFSDDGSKHYFGLEDENGNPYSVNNLYKSKDFNAFLWYIINKSDKSMENGERIWDNRCKSAIMNNTTKKKDIIKCTYIDEAYPMNDKIKIQLCSSNYYKTRKIAKSGNDEWALNKTIFEFNHEFLQSIRLYDPKVIVAEIVQYLTGIGNTNVNLGISINESIIEGKIQQIIRNIIEADDTEINDCYFSFSNDEYNEMLEKAELNRYNIITSNGEYVSLNPNEVLSNLTGITSTSTLINDKTVIKNTLEELIVSPAKDASVDISFGLTYDWQFEILRMLVYPFVRPLFTPKVIFLLLVNKKIMGSLDDNSIADIENLMGILFNIIKDIVIKLKNLLIDMLVQYVLKKLTPLLALFASKLLLESLIAYKDLLVLCLKSCMFGLSGYGNFGSGVENVLDDVNYADIIPTQTIPEQESIC